MLPGLYLHSIFQDEIHLHPRAKCGFLFFCFQPQVLRQRMACQRSNVQCVGIKNNSTFEKIFNFQWRFNDALITGLICILRISELLEKHQWNMIIDEAPLEVENFFEVGIILNSYTLNIASLASHPLAQNLGLKAGEQRSTLGAWMQVDFVLGNGMEV